MKKKERAVRSVTMSVPVRELDGRDIVFRACYLDGSLAGTLKVSQGGVVWKGRGQQWRKTIPWSVFDTIMRDYYNQKRYTPKSL